MQRHLLQCNSLNGVLGNPHSNLWEGERGSRSLCLPCGGGDPRRHGVAARTEARRGPFQGGCKKFMSDTVLGWRLWRGEGPNKRQAVIASIERAGCRQGYRPRLLCASRGHGETLPPPPPAACQILGSEGSDLDGLGKCIVGKGNGRGDWRPPQWMDTRDRHLRRDKLD